MSIKKLGLEGVFEETDIPLPMRRTGISEWNGDFVRMLDRRQLPEKEVYLTLTSTEDVATAIEGMAIQGAFSISIAAGYGLALSANNNNPKDNSHNDDLIVRINNAAKRLIKTRPTGLAIQRMINACLTAVNQAQQENSNLQTAILNIVDQASVALAKQGYETGKNICDLLPDDATILTHCFPDRSYVYLLLESKRRSKNLNVICSETRPYLQGSKLTALCANHVGFNTKVITDGMGGFLMKQGEVDAFITAADRVCMDGTVCNKIGTYQYALAAQMNNIPYYTLRQSGPDRESLTEKDITIEYRNGDEVIYINEKRTTAEGVSGYYPLFDITQAGLVSKIITDRGIFDPSNISDYVTTPAIIADAIV